MKLNAVASFPMPAILRMARTVSPVSRAPRIRDSGPVIDVDAVHEQGETVAGGRAGCRAHHDVGKIVLLAHAEHGIVHLSNDEAPLVSVLLARIQEFLLQVVGSNCRRRK